MRRLIQRQSQGHPLFLLGPVPLHGLRTAHLSRKPEGGSKTPYPSGSAREHSFCDHHHHGKVHDVNILDQLLIELGAIYIMDRGYLDFARLYKIHRASAFFVTRTKRNFSRSRLYSQSVDESTGVQCDQIVVLKNHYAKKDYPEKLRRIRYFDSTDSEPDPFRKRTNLSSTFKCQLHKPGRQTK
jgi:hypothetical protein